MSFTSNDSFVELICGRSYHRKVFRPIFQHEKGIYHCWIFRGMNISCSFSSYIHFICFLRYIVYYIFSHVFLTLAAMVELLDNTIDEVKCFVYYPTLVEKRK
jgi:hypothetical protein